MDKNQNVKLYDLTNDKETITNNLISIDIWKLIEEILDNERDMKIIEEDKNKNKNNDKEKEKEKLEKEIQNKKRIIYDILNKRYNGFKFITNFIYNIIKKIIEYLTSKNSVSDKANAKDTVLKILEYPYLFKDKIDYDDTNKVYLFENNDNRNKMNEIEDILAKIKLDYNKMNFLEKVNEGYMKYYNDKNVNNKLKEDYNRFKQKEINITNHIKDDNEKELNQNTTTTKMNGGKRKKDNENRRGKRKTNKKYIKNKTNKKINRSLKYKTK
jgi:hypothetical protein